MTTLYQLSGAALLGTRRGPVEIKELPLGLELPDLSPEARVLAAAGTLSLYEQSGQLPQRWKQYPLSLPKEDVAKLSPIASRYVSMMLEGTFSDVLPEFFAVMKETFQRLPEEYLPGVLERGKHMYSAREYIKPVLGNTGVWLAEKNPAWHYVLPMTYESASRDWRSSVMLVRQAILKQARVNLPSVGRELVESTWKSESPTDRSWILKTLGVGLSMDDEPFLETALDDRSHTVRKQAAELLSVLPESRLSKRIHEVARQAFVISESLEYQPIEITPQLSRDGISQPNWTDPERVRAAQIVDLISLIHLDFWQLSPQAFISKVLTSNRSVAFMTGLALAIERQQRVDWAKALLVQTDYAANALRLIPLLPMHDLDDLIGQVANLPGPYETMHPVCRILSRCNTPWSEAMTEVWLNLMHQQQAHFPENKIESVFEVITKYMSRYCPRNRIARVAGELGDMPKAYEKICLEPLLTLEFRQKMLQSLGVSVE